MPSGWLRDTTLDNAVEWMSDERRVRPELGPTRIIGYAERLLRAAAETATSVRVDASTNRVVPDVMAEFVALGFYVMWNTLCRAYFEDQADRTMGRVLTETLRQLSAVAPSPSDAHAVQDSTKKFIVKRVQEYESAGGIDSVMDQFAGFLAAAGADVGRAGGAERLLEIFYERIDPNIYLVW